MFEKARPKVTQVLPDLTVSSVKYSTLLNGKSHYYDETCIFDDRPGRYYSRVVGTFADHDVVVSTLRFAIRFGTFNECDTVSQEGK